MSKKLSLKQQKFADEYIITGNTEQSAISAGYSKAYARGKSYTLLANVGIKNYIDERLAEIKSENIADQQEIMETLTAILRGEADGAALVGMGMGEQYMKKDMKPTVAERIKAADLIGKRFAMWTDKQEVDIKGAVTFVDDIGDGDET